MSQPSIPKIGLPFPCHAPSEAPGCPVRENGIGGRKGKEEGARRWRKKWVTPRAGLSLEIRLFCADCLQTG